MQQERKSRGEGRARENGREGVGERPTERETGVTGAKGGGGFELTRVRADQGGFELTKVKGTPRRHGTVKK